MYSLLLLAFPPVMIGFESGNVASVTFLLFALAFRAGGGLVVDGLFGDYGEGAPQGMGPNQGRLQTEGNAYLARDFPKLDYIVEASIAR